MSTPQPPFKETIDITRAEGAGHRHAFHWLRKASVFREPYSFSGAVHVHARVDD